MAARAISSGTISFGLVSIPIKVYTATSGKDVHFSMLHAKDKSRLKQQYVCATCGEIVPRTDTVKGYEYSRDQYVVVTDEELAALQRKTDQSIEIEEFVPIAKVDPIYFEKSSLLGPDKGGQKAYQLLHKAMVETQRVAVGRYSTRGRQQLVLLRPMGEGLAMHGLYYADEVRNFADIEIDKGIHLKDAELELAKQLIDSLAHETFAPEKYEDDYRTAILQAVDRKVAGEEIVAAPPEEAREQIIDLVAALKKSLAEKASAKPAAATTARKSAKAKGKKAASS
ncbi:MAG TPA: Ku protein [Myxococcota bacterium]|nr:Ku protein [Myxococcota bacterium]